MKVYLAGKSRISFSIDLITFRILQNTTKQTIYFHFQEKYYNTKYNKNEKMYWGNISCIWNERISGGGISHGV